MLLIGLAFYSCVLFSLIAMHTRYETRMLAYVLDLYVLLFLFFLMLPRVAHSLYLQGLVVGNCPRVHSGSYLGICDIITSSARSLQMSSDIPCYIVSDSITTQVKICSVGNRHFILIPAHEIEQAQKTRGGKKALAFRIARLLVSIKLQHTSLRNWIILAPSYLIPLLGSAYSRGCHLTCDRIAAILEPEEVEKGLVGLYWAPPLANQVCVSEWIASYHSYNQWATRCWEIVSPTPSLSKRLSILCSQRVHG